MTRFHRRLVLALLISAVVLAANVLAVVNGAAPFARFIGLELDAQATPDGIARCDPRNHAPGGC